MYHRFPTTTPLTAAPQGPVTNSSLTTTTQATMGCYDHLYRLSKKLTRKHKASPKRPYHVPTDGTSLRQRPLSPAQNVSTLTRTRRTLLVGPPVDDHQKETPDESASEQENYIVPHHSRTVITTRCMRGEGTNGAFCPAIEGLPSMGLHVAVLPESQRERWWHFLHANVVDAPPVACVLRLDKDPRPIVCIPRGNNSFEDALGRRVTISTERIVSCALLRDVASIELSSWAPSGVRGTAWVSPVVAAALEVDAGPAVCGSDDTADDVLWISPSVHQSLYGGADTVVGALLGRIKSTGTQRASVSFKALPPCVSVSLRVDETHYPFMRIPHWRPAVERFLVTKCRVLQAGQVLFVPSTALNDSRLLASPDMIGATPESAVMPPFMTLAVDEVWAFVGNGHGPGRAVAPGYSVKRVAAAGVCEGSMPLTRIVLVDGGHRRSRSRSRSSDRGDIRESQSKSSSRSRSRSKSRDRDVGSSGSQRTGTERQARSGHNYHGDERLPHETFWWAQGSNAYDDGDFDSDDAGGIQSGNESPSESDDDGDDSAPEQNASRLRLGALGRLIKGLQVDECQFSDDQTASACLVPGLHVKRVNGDELVLRYNDENNKWSAGKDDTEMTDDQLISVLQEPGTVFWAVNDNQQIVRVQRNGRRSSVSFSPVVRRRSIPGRDDERYVQEERNASRQSSGLDDIRQPDRDSNSMQGSRQENNLESTTVPAIRNNSSTVPDVGALDDSTANIAKNPIAHIIL